MPPQAVTLEPLVQGECVVIVLRLLGRTEHAHQPRSATFLWYEISAQGTGPLANISEKFCLHSYSTIVNCKVLFKLGSRSFGIATLIKQCLFNGLLKHLNALLHACRVVAGFRLFLSQLIADVQRGNKDQLLSICDSSAFFKILQPLIQIVRSLIQSIPLFRWTIHSQ